jgi:hypothetical protein
MKTPISIKFPLRKERVYKKGPWIKMPVIAGLSGSAACAADMVGSAILRRTAASRYQRQGLLDFAKVERNQMRIAATWARVFARQVPDSRLDQIPRLKLTVGGAS